MEVGAAAAGARARVRRSTLAWLCACAAVSGWICFRLATAWPYVNHVVQMPLLVSLPALLYCAAKAGHARLLGRPLEGWRKALALPACAAAGMMLAVGSWEAMDRLSMARFQAQLAPLVAQVAASRAAPCSPALPYVLPPALREYLDASGAVRTGLRINHGDGRVVLSVDGRSADIDGSTVFHDLAAPGWTKFHNDSVARREAFEASILGMASCVVAFGPAT